MRALSVVLALAAVGACGGGEPPTAFETAQSSLADELASDAAVVRYESRDLDDGDAMARIRIPTIGLDVVAVEGVADELLVSAVGHYPGTALPCETGNAAFAGTRQSGGRPFGAVDRLAAGDEIEVTSPAAACTYSVDALLVADPADTSVLEPSTDGRLTLTTTHPLGSTEQRLVVTATLKEVDDPPPTTAAPTTTTTVVQVPRPTGAEAVDALLDAWRAGDRRRALEVADPAPVEVLFAVPASPGEGRGCTTGDANPAVSCVFRLPSGELQVRAAPRAGGFVVDFVFHAAT